MQFLGPLITGLGGAAPVIEGAAPVLQSAGLAMTALQGAGTVFHALSSFAAGRAAKQQADAQAEEQEFQATDARINALNKQTEIKKQLLSTVASQRAAFAASGIDLSSVSVGEAERQATADAEHGLSTTSAEGTRRALAKRRAARNFRIKGQNAFAQGIVGGISDGLNFALDVNRRGLPAQG